MSRIFVIGTSLMVLTQLCAFNINEAGLGISVDRFGGVIFTQYGQVVPRTHNLMNSWDFWNGEKITSIRDINARKTKYTLGEIGTGYSFTIDDNGNIDISPDEHNVYTGALSIAFKTDGEVVSSSSIRFNALSISASIILNNAVLKTPIFSFKFNKFANLSVLDFREEFQAVTVSDLDCNDAVLMRISQMNIPSTETALNGLRGQYPRNFFNNFGIMFGDGVDFSEGALDIYSHGDIECSNISFETNGINHLYVIGGGRCQIHGQISGNCIVLGQAQQNVQQRSNLWNNAFEISRPELYSKDYANVGRFGQLVTRPQGEIYRKVFTAGINNACGFEAFELNRPRVYLNDESDREEIVDLLIRAATDDNSDVVTLMRPQVDAYVAQRGNLDFIDRNDPEFDFEASAWRNFNNAITELNRQNRRRQFEVTKAYFRHFIGQRGRKLEIFDLDCGLWKAIARVQNVSLKVFATQDFNFFGNRGFHAGDVICEYLNPNAISTIYVGFHIAYGGGHYTKLVTQEVFERAEREYGDVRRWNNLIMTEDQIRRNILRVR